jgi:uncharacterized repeat protein (TIGR01451 family)
MFSCTPHVIQSRAAYIITIFTILSVIIVALFPSKVFATFYEPTYGPLQTYSGGGTYIISTTTGDVDGDGDLDLVTARLFQSNVFISLNDGNGNFTEGATFATGVWPYQVTLGDMNNDGSLDIVTANQESTPGDNVSILLNHGDGTFAAHQDYGTAPATRSVALADFDQDGDLDVATGNIMPYGNESVTTYLNNGSGVLTGETYYFRPQASHVTAADVNKDGLPDLAVTSGSALSASIFFNTGNGNFGNEDVYQLGETAVEPEFHNVHSSSFADLDGDGDLDWVIGNRNINKLTFLYNNGDGTFGHRMDCGTILPQFVYIRDFNQDSIIDVMTVNHYASRYNSVSILLGLSDGTYTNSLVVPMGQAAVEAAVGDFNHDTDLDIATANYFGYSLSTRLMSGLAPSNLDTSSNNCEFLPTSTELLPRITTDAPLPGGTVDVAYETQLTAADGTPPYTWSAVADDLPPGLTLNETTGEIGGAPTAAGNFSFTVQVTDNAGAVATKQFALSIQPLFTDVGVSVTEIQFEPAIADAGQPVTVKAKVQNLGLSDVADIRVDFLDFGTLLEQTTITSLPAGTASEVTFETTYGEAGLRLISIRVDPDDVIAELNEDNNEASKVLQVGQPDLSQATLVVQASAVAVCQGQAVAINGQAYYDFSQMPGENDYPVQGGRVTVTLLEPATNSPLSIFTGAHTEVNGQFSQAVIAPANDGAYAVRVAVTDQTLTRERQTTLTVEGACPVPPPVLPPPGSGLPPPNGPAVRDVYIGAEDIYFTNNHPDPGETIPIFAYIHYYGIEPVQAIPVTLYDVLPVNGALARLVIGATQVNFQSAGGTAVVSIPWSGNIEGAHVIQVVVEPPFDQFTQNDKATRLILVGDASPLEIQKSLLLLLDADGDGKISPGDRLQYTISYRNNGPGEATNAVILDDYDEGLLAPPTQISHGGALGNGVITWPLGTLTAGASGSITYQVDILPAAQFPPGRTKIGNVALLAADQAPAVADSVEVEVLVNRAPLVGVELALVTGDEGETVSNHGAVSDADGDMVTLSASVGTVNNNGDGSWSWSFFAGDGPVNPSVTISADDGHGGLSSANFVLTVNNVAPVIASVSNNGPITEGDAATITVEASDAAGANDPLSYEFDCDHNGVYEVGPQADNSAPCTFGSAGSYTVNVRVSDGDGGEASGATLVTVNPAPPTIIERVAIQDSFLRSGNDNTNEGANLNLMIRSDGNNRVLVTFDLAGLSGPVGSATLRLYIVYNADNWGNSGRTIDAHRVTQVWTEGNGANLQPGNLTNAQFRPYEKRGGGPGVTWRCAVDAEVQNQASDCNPKWNGGAYVATPTASVTIYKDFAGSTTLPPTSKSMGWISLDVTADVNSCLANGESQCGWLIRKRQEGQPGRVEFASKEGAAALYNSQVGEAVAPRLVINAGVGAASLNSMDPVNEPMKGEDGAGGRALNNRLFLPLVSK